MKIETKDKKIKFEDGGYVTGTNPQVAIQYYTVDGEGEWCAQLMDGNSCVMAVKIENNKFKKKRFFMEIRWRKLSNNCFNFVFGWRKKALHLSVMRMLISPCSTDDGEMKIRAFFPSKK